MISSHSFNRFPLWQFLQQPVFSPNHRLILHPRRFWHRYHIELLERCLLLKVESTDVPYEQ